MTSLPDPRSYPAPWRMPPEGTNPELEAAAQRSEEEDFQQIMAEARNADVPVEVLLKKTLHLAFPNAHAEDVEWAYTRMLQELAAWKNALDGKGNPAWLTLPNSTPEDEGGLRPETVLPQGPGKAYPDEAVAEAKEKKKRPSLFYGVAAFLRGLLGLRQKNKVEELPEAQAPSRVLLVLRLAFFALFFLSTYKYLVKHGIIAPLW